METKEIVECLEMCAEKLGCQRYIIGNCEENVRIGNVLDEAAKRLEELDAELEKRAINDRPYEWINVEERLPEEKQNVLAYDINDVGIIYIAFYFDGLWRQDDIPHVGVDTITHWMPLPGPPKPKEPTFKDVFLKAFPKTPLGYNGALKLCARNVFPQINCSLSNGCAECWKQTYFEEEGEADA